MQNRLRVLSSIFILGFLLLVTRLFYWQIIKSKDLSIKAREQHQTDIFLNATRGNILANDGTWLVASGESWLVYAELNKLDEDRNKIADKIGPLLADINIDDPEYKDNLLEEVNRLKESLQRTDVVWVPLKHKVATKVKENIQALGVKGIGFEFEEARLYPEASSAAHLLGFVGKNSEGEDQGYFGLEGYYDLVLSGKPGFIARDSDARGIPIFLADSKKIEAVKGVNLLTNIDKAIQILIDKMLISGIEKYGAKGGNVIVMDPKTGGIIGMSSYPSFDPKKYFEYGNEFFINPAVSLSFEPGSIFKVLVMAAALNEKVVEPGTKCDICSGPIKIDKYLIETWNKEYRPESSMTDVIVHSDNVGMVYVGKKLGSDKLYDYLNEFGLGQTTGIDLQGEMSPQLREKNSWSEIDLTTASFGQGVAVTPIQIISAINTIANKGVYVNPKVISSIVSGNQKEEIYSDIQKRVISEKTASQITEMMVEAAKNGESKWTYLRGFKVAGKTGTAQIPISGHYDEEKTIASFIGFVPYNDPKFIMLVTLHQPQSSPWASETAAPLWYSIAKELFLYFGIQPEK